MFFSVREQLKLFFIHPVFLSCVFSWFCAQFLKTAIALFYNKIHSLPQLFEIMFWRTGGMPSSHSALVASLCTSIGFKNGFDSDLFVLALCFLLITVRDALGVRRASGIQARKLNEIGKELSEKKMLSYKPIKEVMGHSPLEVSLGVVLGVSIGAALSLLQ